MKASLVFLVGLTIVLNLAAARSPPRISHPTPKELDTEDVISNGEPGATVENVDPAKLSSLFFRKFPLKTPPKALTQPKLPSSAEISVDPIRIHPKPLTQPKLPPQIAVDPIRPPRPLTQPKLPQAEIAVDPVPSTDDL
ncbi:uncharacterized protein LOC129915432 [Episyrphus balteatus]|uniref:uncharacterized protein LOC129915432 n=1 Tax=Episyrphus balteatus TaxID=286459 RepID=UPI00248592CE|nr:uncharacterized protein LOC129915432 [Episyrphus balteatus]